MCKFDHNTGKCLTIDDAKVYYEIIGNVSEPVLLFLHGGLGNIEAFNAVISELLGKFRIIGIDCRGHGKSTLGSSNLTYELLQKDIERILKNLGIGNLTIIGFSNGGTIAYRLAALTNLKINKLITIGSPWCTKHVEHLFDAYSKLTSEDWKVQCPADFESYQRLNPEPEFDILFKQVIGMALDISTTGRPNERVQNITCPSIIMRGEKDPVVSSSDILELSKLISNSHILNIPSAGHEAFKDQPEFFTMQLKQFLAPC